MRTNQFCSQTKVEDQSKASKVSYGLAIRAGADPDQFIRFVQTCQIF